MTVDAVNLDAVDADPCCRSHVGGLTPGACCDPEDCGPCCPNCPTCPAVQRAVDAGPRPTLRLTEARLRTLRAMTAAYATGVTPEQRIEAVGAVLDELADLQRRNSVLDELTGLLCPCDPNPDTTQGPLQECIVHGDTPAVAGELRVARAFRDEVFWPDAWESGREWGRRGIVDRTSTLDPDDEQAYLRRRDRYFADQVARYAELVSRMLGRLAGFRQAVAERGDDAGRQPVWPERNVRSVRRR